MRQIAYALLGFFTLVFLWELFSLSSPHLRFVLPAPSKVLICLLVQKERFFFHALVTLKEMGAGFILALCLAFPLAWMMALYASFRYFLQPLFVVVQCIPMFTLAPIMVFWFDFSFAAIVVPTALMIFFPLTMNIYQGVRSTPSRFLHYFQRNGASTWQIFTKLQLPFALPHIFAGFRISAAIGGIGAVAGEWAGGEAGLGVLMLESRRAADLPTTFGALFCLTILSLALYLLTARLEKMRRVFASLLLVCMLSSCQSTERDKPHRLALDWLPNPNHVPLFVGVEKGIFEKHGIPLKLQKLHDPSDALPYLTSGQADFALTYMPHTLYALAKGARIKPVGVLMKEPLNAVLFRKGEGIETPRDLSGKRMGYCVDGTETEILDEILAHNHIEPLQKRNVSCDLVSSLALGRVDALYGAYWNIEGEHLRALGVETDYFKLEDLGVPNYCELIVVAREDLAPERAHCFQEALQESIDYALQHPEEAFALYLAANPDKAAVTQEWEARAWEKTQLALAHTQEMDQKEWDVFSAWMPCVLKKSSE